VRVATTIALVGLGLLGARVGTGAELPDPTRPYLYNVTPPVSVPEKGKEQWRLSGVQIRANSRSAILNGQVVKVGDKIGAASVVRIEPWQVTLNENYRDIVVNLLMTDVKVRAGNIEKHE
jgi:hypothetical protein